LAGLVLGSSAALVLGAAQQGQRLRRPLLPDVSATRQQQLEAFRQGGLLAAARVGGGFIDRRHGSEVVVESLRDLVSASSAILTGAVVARQAKLVNDGRAIVTDFKVNVEGSLKGHLRPGAPVSVRVTGGRVMFNDGTWAETRTDGFQLPKEGERFTWFLSPELVADGSPNTASAEQRFRLTHGTWGLFQVTSQGLIGPKGPRAGIGLRYRRYSSAAFAAEVTRLVDQRRH
jgi:hypothetical protein